MSTSAPAKSLYERLGGVYAIATVVDNFIVGVASPWRIGLWSIRDSIPIPSSMRRIIASLRLGSNT
jgi:hypothetical protein